MSVGLATKGQFLLESEIRYVTKLLEGAAVVVSFLACRKGAAVGFFWSEESRVP